VKKIKDILQKFKAELKEVYKDKKEIEAIFYELLHHYHSITKFETVLNPQLEIDEYKLNEALEKLKLHTPWQYITGETLFNDILLMVNKNVLIPRPETEELIKWIVEDMQDASPQRILDIGTGSGAIAISLAKYFSRAQVFAFDVSREALETAQINAKRNQVNISFLQVDILGIEQFENYFDIIISNPPYVRQEEKKLMRKNVLDFEPESALFVPDDNPLVFYDKITDLFIKNSRRGGKLFFEINEFLKPKLEDLLKEKKISNYQFKKDIFDKWRMLKVSID